MCDLRVFYWGALLIYKKFIWFMEMLQKRIFDLYGLIPFKNHIVLPFNKYFRAPTRCQELNHQNSSQFQEVKFRNAASLHSLWKDFLRTHQGCNWRQQPTQAPTQATSLPMKVHQLPATRPPSAISFAWVLFLVTQTLSLNHKSSSLPRTRANPVTFLSTHQKSSVSEPWQTISKWHTSLPYTYNLLNRQEQDGSFSDGFHAIRTANYSCVWALFTKYMSVDTV